MRPRPRLLRPQPSVHDPALAHFEQLAGLFVLLLIAVGCFVVLRPFIAALLWATILSISTWPAFRRLGAPSAAGRRQRRGDDVLLAIALLAPIGLLGTSLADNFAKLALPSSTPSSTARRRRRRGLTSSRHRAGTGRVMALFRRRLDPLCRYGPRIRRSATRCCWESARFGRACSTSR